MKLMKAVAIAVVLAAGSARAEQKPTEPNAVARAELMKLVGMNTGILGGMASGKDAYDTAKAEAAKAALVEASAKIETTFREQGAGDPASEAKPEIWSNWDDFLVKAKALGNAAGAVDTGSAQAIGAGMGAIGSACKDCHTTYRVAR